MKRLFILLVFFMSSTVMGFTTPHASSVAQNGFSDKLLLAEGPTKNISIDKVVSDFKKQEGVRVLSAIEKDENGDKYYLIKIISKGRVKVYKIDPATGNPKSQ